MLYYVHVCIAVVSPKCNNMYCVYMYIATLCIALCIANISSLSAVECIYQYLQMYMYSGDRRGNRYQHRGRSSSSSSNSDSQSSSDSDRRGRGRKRIRYSKNRSSSTEDMRKQRCKDYDGEK